MCMLKVQMIHKSNEPQQYMKSIRRLSWYCYHHTPQFLSNNHPRRHLHMEDSNNKYNRFNKSQYQLNSHHHNLQYLLQHNFHISDCFQYYN